MRIRIDLSRDPVEVPLVGPFAGVVLTVRRLTSPDYIRAQEAARAILRDKSALAQVLLRHKLVTSADDLARAQSDLTFQAGFGAWLATVECGLAGIVAWSGIELMDGSPAPLPRDLTKVAGIAEPVDPADLAAREVMESLLLDQGFAGQVEAALNRSSRLLAIEGNVSGLSGNGSAAAAPTTTGGPTGADTAKPPESPAPTADGTGPGDAAPL